MNNYLAVEIPHLADDGEDVLNWGEDPKDAIKAIQILERDYPNYDFHQFVTSTTGLTGFAIMKHKPLSL